jgi:transcription antitermination factor NusG
LAPTETQRRTDDGFPWYALWVRSRHEKSVAEILEGKGFETFLPMHTSRRRWSDRVQELELPLIPGYVFSRFDANYRLPVLTTPGLVQIVSAGKTPQPVDEDEMQSLITAVRAGVHLRLWPFLKSGQRVSIEEGPLRSLEGVLISTKGSDQLILSISLLQRSVAVAVDRRWVRPIAGDSEIGRRTGSSTPFARERISFAR